MVYSSIIQFDESGGAGRQSFDKIPLVDLAPLFDASDLGKVAKEIRWALTNTGFMYIKNHGVPTRLIDETFTEARAFFDLPAAEKKKLHIGNSGTTMRGYIQFFGENSDPARTNDLKECFDVGSECQGVESPFFGPNQWPASLPAFRETVSSYHQVMNELSTKILCGIALSLDLPADFFQGQMKRPIMIQRLAHYPPQTGVVDEKVIGVGAHTDFGNLTILAQDCVGGLQVLNHDGIWVGGNPVPGNFVVNIGDLMQILTNNRYLANLHRVVNTSGQDSYSLPFFLDADYDAVIAPMESCVSNNKPALYQPTTCGVHKFARLVENFPHLHREHVSGPGARPRRPRVL
ncbi:isopenicillin N synthase family oxygenase [Mesorhizobium sp. M1A.F.Ca.ET.072.01.1.1]|uniref:isopenicillin N synthase family dioxygenase n=1 Tax=Mesorhizobium sp. M1A.F.Ca.ET.072.01.1.1 TaxID=2496753 RepID=UPI000FD4DE31|nr:2-oxoglutarate and iron-dependent oxygenase domain-containing protein [Mesorhizobium sp. M1A.F.Ca.ET.072.01.1.1]RUW54079.1 isopenicillin N synthase family oxygenase [Mesorhizobium sp. M1A.F.Ca.ET.072.01.1.1]TIV04054.1 MAG: isopenicillin N synthase family oxygenase [Mesorhizobium sp.]